MMTSLFLLLGPLFLVILVVYITKWAIALSGQDSSSHRRDDW